MNTEPLTYIIRFDVGGELVALGLLSLVAFALTAYYGLAIWSAKE